jgi:hypothetical protein
MGADIHDGSEHDTLQSEAGYIDARPHVRQIDEILLQRTAGPYIGSDRACDMPDHGRILHRHWPVWKPGQVKQVIGSPPRRPEEGWVAFCSSLFRFRNLSFFAPCQSRRYVRGCLASRLRDSSIACQTSSSSSRKLTTGICLIRGRPRFFFVIRFRARHAGVLQQNVLSQRIKYLLPRLHLSYFEIFRSVDVRKFFGGSDACAPI